jgi:HEPN domain-containing protein
MSQKLSLQACLRIVAVDYPKKHDFGKILKSVADRFPSWFRSETVALSRISGVLAAKRAASMHGLEAAGKKPSEIFGEGDARTALSDAGYALPLAQRLSKDPLDVPSL